MSKDLYAILPTPRVDFDVGLASNGRQAILGVLFSNVVVYMFDSKGSFLWRECHPWRTSELPHFMSFQQSQDIRFRAGIDYRVSKLRQQFDLKEAPIVIEEFFDEDLFVGVQKIPAYLERGADNETQREYQERCSERRDWIESGKFVFWWAKDYWLFNAGNSPSAKRMTQREDF